MYKLSKALFALFMINYIWLSRTIGAPSWLNYVLVAGFTVTGLLSSRDFSLHGRMLLRLNKYFRYWALFVIYVLLTGFIVAKDFSIVLSQVTFLIEVLLIMEYVSLVSEKEGSLKFFYQVFMVVSALYTLSMLRSGVVHSRSGRLYLSESSNPNSDGIILAFGVYSTLKLIDFKRLGNLIPLFALSIIEFYGIFLTGSRKALILAAIFFVFSFFRIWNLSKEMSGKAKTFLAVVSLVAIVFGVVWMIPVYMRSSAFQRMQLADVGMKDRWDIAYDALRVFYQHPFFGVGINNYKLYSSFGLYAHSTIPELLAGTGIIGLILFFLPYFSVLNSLLKKSVTRIDRVEIWRLLICIMAVSIVMIIPYGLPLSFFSVLLFMETDLAKKRSD
jgi:O-antigen ligase